MVVAGAFDLRDEAWIPVRTSAGQRRVGLRELFKDAHQIEDLEVPVPPAASGLLRILAAIAARVGAADDGTTLDDEDEAESLGNWLQLRRRVLGAQRFDPAVVDAYFDRPDLAGRFELFGEARPFLQDPRLVRECVDGKGEPNTSGVNKLVLGRPTGLNGAVLFGHFTDAAPMPAPAAEAAFHLIAQLYYGPSGQCTPRKITSNRAGNGDAGPLRKTVSFHPWGPNLFTTLVLAVPSPTDAAEPDPADCPWERDELPSPLGPLPPTTWPGGVLTGRARHAVLLVPSNDGTQATDAYVTWSTHETAPSTRDPYLIYDEPKKDGEPYARTADSRRAVWRDVDALLRSDAHRSERPAILNDLALHVPRGLRDDLRIRAYGFDQDGQQRDAGWYEATTPPVLRWFAEVDPAMALHANRCRAAGELVAEKLDYAAMLAWELATKPPEDPTAQGKVKVNQKTPGPWARAATSTYWPLAERVFWSMLSPERCDERSERAFVEVALRSLDEAMGVARGDIRGARAWNRARRIIQNVVPRDEDTPPQSPAA